jgi:hypothetical protein
MSRPPHPPSFNHPNNIRWRIQVMKFIVVQFAFREEQNIQNNISSSYFVWVWNLVSYFEGRP